VPQAGHFHLPRSAAFIRCRDRRRILHGHRLVELACNNRDASDHDQREHDAYHQCRFEKIFHGYTSICVSDSVQFTQACVKMR